MEVGAQSAPVSQPFFDKHTHTVMVGYFFSVRFVSACLCRSSLKYLPTSGDKFATSIQQNTTNDCVNNNVNCLASFCPTLPPSNRWRESANPPSPSSPPHPCIRRSRGRFSRSLALREEGSQFDTEVHTVRFIRNTDKLTPL